MAGLFNNFLNQFSSGDSLRDYRHATRLFVDGLYRLSPKLNNLFHVFIDLDPTIIMDSTTQTEIGMMAKEVQLPKFTVTTKTYNAYNRKNIAQEKISYDPVQFTFHDDSSDVVRNFWYSYYTYYYRDADHMEAAYEQAYKYQPRTIQNWGFTKASRSANASNFIRSIRIYSLHQKSFSSYILIHPIISSFSHGQHAADGGYSPMTHTMTVNYEAVHYETGYVSDGTVRGFGGIHYDHHPSSLAGLGTGLNNIFGVGGLVQGINATVNNLQNGNYLGAILSGAQTLNNATNPNYSPLATGSLSQIGTNILRGQNPTSSVFVPTAGSLQQGMSRATTSMALPGSIDTSLSYQSSGLPSQPTATPDVGSTSNFTAPAVGDITPIGPNYSVSAYADVTNSIGGAQAVTTSGTSVAPDFTPISVAGNQLAGDAAITNTDATIAPDFTATA
jgi:hypothetical protein